MLLNFAACSPALALQLLYQRLINLVQPYRPVLLGLELYLDRLTQNRQQDKNKNKKKLRRHRTQLLPKISWVNIEPTKMPKEK